MKKLNKTKKKKIRNISILIILCFLLSIFLLQRRNNISFIEKLIRDIFLTPLNITSDVISSNKEITQDDSLNLLKLENDELKKEIDELKNIININDMLSDKVAVTANVVNRNIGYFFDNITINKGSSSGITEGMAVVAGTGLIGKTKQVSNYYSDIVLLTSKSIGKISVKIDNNDNTFVYGLLNGYDIDTNVYYIEGISETTNVNIGSLVTTTGMGDIFPSGILIGTVTNITTDHFDLSKIVEVSPSVNINDFTVVSILKRNVNS